MRKSTEIWLCVAITAGCVILAFGSSFFARATIAILEAENGTLSPFIVYGMYLIAVAFPAYLILKVLKITYEIGHGGKF